MKAKKIFKSLFFSATTLFVLSGCAASNPFGIGYDKSVCENASDLGFCGRPEDIYKYKEKVKKVQEEYVKSGIGQQLFFAITNDGTVLVKADREGKWYPFYQSRWYKIIKARLKKQRELMNLGRNANANNISKANLNTLNQDIPVTEGNDLSVKYKRQGTILQTRTNVGNLIRDYGLIQKVWIAPYVDKKGNLVTAHEIFVVVRNPEWIVGEKYPNRTKYAIGEIPTPISQSILQEQQKYDRYNENVINYYNQGLEKNLQKTLNNNPHKEQKTIEKNMNIIYDFLNKQSK